MSCSRSYFLRVTEYEKSDGELIAAERKIKEK